MLRSPTFGSLTLTLAISFFDKIPRLMVAALLAGSCLLILNGCDAQDISNESTVGSNNIAQTEPDIINRNSMQDVTTTHSKDSQHDNNDSQERHQANPDNAAIKP